MLSLHVSLATIHSGVEMPGGGSCEPNVRTAVLCQAYEEAISKVRPVQLCQSMHAYLSATSDCAATILNVILLVHAVLDLPLQRIDHS